MGLNRYRVVTDGQTDRITMANTRLRVPAVALKNATDTFTIQPTISLAALWPLRESVYLQTSVMFEL